MFDEAASNMNELRIVTLLFSVFLFSGCTSSSTFTVNSVGHSPPPSGYSKIYVSRPSMLMGVAAKQDVFIDGELIGILTSGTTLEKVVAPGEYVVTVKTVLGGMVATTKHTKTPTKYVLECIANKSHYLGYHMGLASWSGAPEQFKTYSANIGKSISATMKPKNYFGELKDEYVIRSK